MSKKKALFLLPILLLMSSCGNEIRKTPLEWCLWEIHTHADYNCEWSYIYNDIYNYDASQTDTHISAYYITAFTDERIGEWYCMIKCELHDFFDRMAGRRTYSASDVLMIDCDLVREELIDE